MSHKTLEVERCCYFNGNIMARYSERGEWGVIYHC